MKTFPVWLCSVLLVYVQASDLPVNCNFPLNLRGVWISTYNGPLVFDSTTIFGYKTDVPNAPPLQFNCIERNETFYILKSTHIFEVFGQTVHLYLCLEIQEQSNSVFQYHIRTGYEEILREYIYGHIPGNILGDVCDSTFRKSFLLVRNVSLTNRTIGNDCPSIIQGNYVNMSDTCNSGNLRACEKSIDFQLFIENDCSTVFDNTTFTCLHYLEGQENYLYTWTDSVEFQSLSSYGFFCMDISKSNNMLTITIFPDYCSKNSSHNALLTTTILGLSAQCYPSELTTTVSKVTTLAPESPTNVVVVVVIVLLVCLIVLIVFFLLHLYRKKLGIDCVFKKQTSDDQFDAIS